MTNVLRMVGWFIASIGLVCMAIYVWLAFNENEELLKLHRGNDLSVRAKAFLIAALITFIFCIYAGTNVLLGWMPESWAGFDEDGNYTTSREIVAGVYAMAVGGALVSIVERVMIYRFENKFLRDRAKTLEDALRKLG